MVKNKYNNHFVSLIEIDSLENLANKIFKNK